jgi:PAS domain S-box-containing protein
VKLADEHFRLLVESVEDYAIYLLDPDGIVQSWNAGAQRIKGYTSDEIVGQSFSRFYTESDRASRRPQQVLDAARRHGRVEESGWRVRKDGSRFWANIVVTALRERNGQLMGFAKVTRDLTDRAYRAFVEATNGIVWTTDADGAPNADSPSWREFTGQTEGEWRGMRGWEPVHPEDQSILRDAWPRAKEARTAFEAEFRLRRHDGIYVWMGCRAVPFVNSDGAVREWFGVTVDISARKTAELERERALNWWATTLRSIGDGVIATDRSGNVTFLNPVAEHLTGWALDEAMGKPLLEVFPIFHEETRVRAENPVQKVLREGVVVGLANHTVLRRRDGVETPIDDSAAPIRGSDGSLDGVVLVFRDASIEKLAAARRNFLARAGDELMAAHDHRTALEHVAQLAVPQLADWCTVDIVDPTTNQLQQVALAHIDPSKVTFARELARRFPPDLTAQSGAPNVMRTGRSELYREITPELLERGARDAEHLRIIRELDLRSAMVVPLRGRDRIFGAITFVYSGGRRYTDDDLTFAEELARRVAVVLERRRAEEDAAAANRTKDEFLAMLGHELRNPLAPIRIAVQLMSLRNDPASAKEREVIERQVEHLITLVDDLLDVSRITRSKIELVRAPLEISAVLARALEMASPILEQRRHHLEVAVPRTGLVVDGDAARLAQVFSNLLTNAAKYTDPGGRISVVGSRVDGEIVVSVADTGIGIAPDILPTVFEMFVQERQSSARSLGGLGLGLSIVRSLVTMHGGTVTASSPGRGHGSTFVVKLPGIETKDVAITEEIEAVTAVSLGKRVLVVDDNVDAATMMAHAIRGWGYEVHEAFDGASALQIAGQVRPDVALLDLGLPVMDGYELAERLRELAPLHLIALTGYGTENDQERSRAAGFDRHLVKPIAIDVVRETLADLLA